ncbi:MAG: aldo/keto reductase [Planctomycetota bacterium]
MNAIENSPGFDPSIDLGDGVRMPLVGCGTQFGFCEDGHERGRPEHGAHYVAKALGVGFRMLDTARGYGTETHVMAGLAEAGVARRDAFVVSKAWVGVDHPPGLAASRAAITESAARLGGHVDLFLVHQPVAGWQDLWRALEDAKDAGHVRAIGVSNFGIAHLDELAGFARHRPVANQIHLHPFVFEGHRDTIRACAERGIRIMAFPRTPWRLGPGTAIDSVAAECGITRAQVMLRWAVEHGFAVIPLSTDDRHLAENFAVRTLRLSPEQLARIDRLAERPRVRYHVDEVTATRISGWAFVTGSTLRIRVLAGDQVLGEASHGQPRPDVQAAHSGAPEALASGFAFTLPRDGFGAGQRQITLSFETADHATGATCILTVPSPDA